MGASVDNNTGTMFVNSSSVPSITWLEKIKKIVRTIGMIQKLKF